MTHAAPAADLRVVATIGPVHAIASALLHDVATPDLLVEGSASPHAYALKPSDARRLAEAAIVVLASPRLETFMERALRRLSRGARIVVLEQAPGLHLLPVRGGAPFAAHAHDGHDHGSHSHREMDVHFWLDPENGKAAARHLAQQLGAALPVHRPAIERNLASLSEEIDKTQTDIRGELADLRERPFFVFHDAYQYFERRFGLEAAGSIVTGSDGQPGAKRLLQIRETLINGRAVCVFAEPQFDAELARVLVEGTSAKVGTLDPEGRASVRGTVNSYPDLLRNLARDFAACVR